MTQQMGTWRVQYRPGDWIVLSGPTSLVVLQPASEQWSELVATLWEQVVASVTITDLAARLAGYGVDSMPSFAALFWHTDGLRSLVRGDVSLTDVETGATIARGEDVLTWSEVGLSGVEQVEVVLPAARVADPQAMLLPLVIGVVRASSVVLDARAAALLTSPQPLSGTGRALAPPGPGAPAGGAARAGGVLLPGVPPITDDVAGALGTQGYLGTESGAESDSGTESGADVESGVDSDPDPGSAADRDDQPHTEVFDVADVFSAEEASDENGPAEPGRDENLPVESIDQDDDADTELMFLPAVEITSAIADDEDASIPDAGQADDAKQIDDENENANTELMYLPAADPSLSPEPVAGDQEADQWGLTRTEEVAVDPTHELGAEFEGWPHDPEVSAPASESGTAGRMLIMAVSCPRHHPNPPPAGVCRVCGEAITPQSPRLVARPVLARLRGPGGDSVDLDRPVRIGRAPSPDGDADQRLMTVVSPSQDISRTHLEVAPDGWQVIATDLYSTNGTVLVSSDGEMGPYRLSPGEPVVLELGAVLDLGDGVTISVDPPPEH